MDDKQYKQTFRWLLIAGLAIGFCIAGFIFGAWGSVYFRDSKVLSTKVEYLQGNLELYEDLLDYTEEEYEELQDENTRLRDKIAELENDYNGELHESYTECLVKIREDYKFDNYVVKQVGMTYANTDDIIYHFIIVIYNTELTEVKTFNCYAVYDGDEFMYADCDLVEE